MQGNLAVPTLIEGSSISNVWAQMFLRIMKGGGREITPLIISITGFEGQRGIQPEEDWKLRSELDGLISEQGKFPLDGLAHGIFPLALWEKAGLGEDRHRFFELVKRWTPDWQTFMKWEFHMRYPIKDFYFNRMINYGRGPCDGNQIEWILSQYLSRPGVRRSMFQISIFDPERDHNARAQTPFPCLQHLSFNITKDGLTLNAYYATQQLFDKAYANYLGLCHLGIFLSKEMGIPLYRVNDIAGIGKLDNVKKNDTRLNRLIEISEDLVNER